MFVILLFCLLPSASFTADLQDLVSASNDFEVEMIEHEHVLERSPSATEPDQNWLKLVGTIGRDEKSPIIIGSAMTNFSPSKSGELFCFANDVGWM